MKEFLNFEAIARWEGDIAYAASMDYNALFEVDMLTGDCKYIRMFNERYEKKRLFTTAYKVGEKIYFIPSSADRIAIYKPKENHLYEIEIDSVNKLDHKFYKSNAKFNGGIIKDNFLYLTPCTYPAIIRINANNDEIDYFGGWFNGDFVFRKAPYLDDSIIYLPDTNSNRVLKFDTDSCKGNFITIPTKYYGWWSMCKIEDKFWLSPKEPGPIICWNEKANTVIEYDEYPVKYVKTKFYATLIFEHEGAPFILPAFANMGLSIDIRNNFISSWEIEGVNEETEVWFLFLDGNDIYIKIKTGESVAYRVINKCTLCTREVNFRFVDNIKKYKEDRLNNISGRVLKEGISVGLSDYLRMI